MRKPACAAFGVLSDQVAEGWRNENNAWRTPDEGVTPEYSLCKAAWAVFLGCLGLRFRPSPVQPAQPSPITHLCPTDYRAKSKQNLEPWNNSFFGIIVRADITTSEYHRRTRPSFL